MLVQSDIASVELSALAYPLEIAMANNANIILAENATATHNETENAANSLAHGTDIVEHASESTGMPQLDFSTFSNQIFWLLVTLVILYLILTRIAMPRIENVLADRQGAIQRDLDRAEEMKHQAKEAEVSYEKALFDARAQAQEIVAEAKVDIQKDLDLAIEHADAEISAKTVESEKAINIIRESAVKSIQEVANTTATEIVKAMMPAAVDAKAIKAAVSSRLKG